MTMALTHSGVLTLRCIAQHSQLFGSNDDQRMDHSHDDNTCEATGCFSQVEKTAYVETIHKPPLAQSL